MNQNFNLNSLWYFMITAETCNMTKAAEKIHLTQPALSGAINKLESELGVKLFDRIGRNRIVLNQYGQILLRGITTAFRSISDSISEMADLSTPGSGLIRFATPSDGILMDLIESFIIDNPSVHVVQKFTYGSSTADDLKNRELDFAISYAPFPDNDFEWHPLADFQLAVLLSESHPLSVRDALSLADLRGESFVFYVSSDEFPAIFRQLCARANIHPHIAYQGSTPSIVNRMLQSGSYISIVPANGGFMSADQTNRVSKYLYANGIKAVPLGNNDCYFTLGYSTLKNHYLPGAARDLLNRIQKELPEMDCFVAPPDD